MSVSAISDGRTDAPSLDRGSLTWVDLVWFERRIERWIRFGTIAGEEILDRRRRRVAFRPGALFAFVRWAANDLGTVSSRIDILQAVGPGTGGSTVPGVTPGGCSLLRIAGWPRVAAVLAAIDAVEALGVDPADAAPDHWRHVHAAVSAQLTPRTYSLARHHAWRLRQELGAC